MYARKLGRFIGLAFALAAVVGGLSVAHVLTAHGGSISSAGMFLLETIWG